MQPTGSAQNSFFDSVETRTCSLCQWKKRKFNCWGLFQRLSHLGMTLLVTLAPGRHVSRFGSPPGPPSHPRLPNDCSANVVPFLPDAGRAPTHLHHVRAAQNHAVPAKARECCSRRADCPARSLHFARCRAVSVAIKESGENGLETSDHR